MGYVVGAALVILGILIILFGAFFDRFAHAHRPINHVGVECFQKCAAVPVTRLADEALHERLRPFAKIHHIIANRFIYCSPCRRYIVPGLLFLLRTAQLKTRNVVYGAV